MNRRLYIKQEYKEFINKLLEIWDSDSILSDVFQDFIRVANIMIKNIYDYSQEDEDLFIKIINKYKKTKQKKFAEAFAIIVQLYLEQDDYIDILGEIYEAIGLANGTFGQVFTPMYISEMMANVIEAESNVTDEEINKVFDYCCGSGRLLLGYASIMKKQKKGKFIFKAYDIDFNCICMTFIQFSLYSIPAIITLGDSAEEEVRKVLYTPECIKEINRKNSNRRK